MRRPLLAIFLIVLVDVFGLTLVIPLLAIYAEHMGASPLAVDGTREVEHPQRFGAIYLAAGLSLTSIICTATLLSGGKPPQRSNRPRRPWRHFTRGALVGLFFQFLCFALAFGSFTAGFALFTERRLTWNGHPFGPREIGYVFAYAGLLGMILQGVLIAFLAMVIGYGGLAITSSVPMLLVMVTFSAIGNSALRPALTSLVTQAAEQDEQGAVLGVTQSINSIAQIAAPALAGVVIGKGWLGVWACLAGGAAVLGVVAQRCGASSVRTPMGGNTSPDVARCT